MVSTVASASMAVDSFGDQFVSLRSDDVNAQNFAVLFVGHNFHEAVMRAENGGLAVGTKGNFPTLTL